MATEIDDYSRHEALDRTNMLAQMVGTWLLCHPYIANNPAILDKIEKAGELLAEAYQEIGVEHL